MLKGKFTVPIFGAKVEVYIGDPYQIVTHYGWSVEGGMDKVRTCAGGVFKFEGNGHLGIVLEENADIGRVVAHEVHHLTDFILDWAGVPLGVCDETHAYLMGFLMGKVLKIINKGKDKND